MNLRDRLHPRPHGLAWLLAGCALAWASGCASSGGGSGGDGGGDVIPDPPIPISGEYDAAVETTLDGCDLGGGSIRTPMLVDETGPTSAELDLPAGRAGGECNRIEFTRDGNTLQYFKTSVQQVGPCPVQVDVATVLDFFDDGTVVGSETDQYTPLDATACAGVLASCSVELTLVAARCDGCFSCTPAGAGAADDGRGALARAAGMAGTPHPVAVD